MTDLPTTAPLIGSSENKPPNVHPLVDELCARFGATPHTYRPMTANERKKAKLAAHRATSRMRRGKPSPPAALEYPTLHTK